MLPGLAATLAVVWACVAGAQAEHRPALSCAQPYTAIVEQMSHSVVAITPLSARAIEDDLGAELDDKATGIGTGVVVYDGDYVLTNAHVVERAVDLAVTLRDGGVARAMVVGLDEDLDLALLQVLERPPLQELRPAPMGDSAGLVVGEEVVAIGHPMGLEFSASVGIVSGLGRSGFGIASYEDYVQTDAAINLGNSGGPLVDLCGQVVGINTWIIGRTGNSPVPPQSLGFAIPINAAMWVAQQLRDHGNVVHPWAGVTLEPIPQATKLALALPAGLLVHAVEDDSPAAHAGILPDDLLLTVDGRTMGSRRDFQREVTFHRLPGEEVLFGIRRAGNDLAVAVSLGSVPGELYLGLSVAPDIKESSRLMVVGIDRGGPAEAAGIYAGDQVLRAGIDADSTAPVASVADMRAAIARGAVGRQLVVVLLRARDEITVVIDMQVK